MTNFSTYDNIRRFANQMKSMGVDDRLKESGVEVGDLIILEGFEFEFEEKNRFYVKRVRKSD